MTRKMVSAHEYKAIVDIISSYVDAIRTGNIDLLVGLFHHGAVTYGIVDGEIQGGAGNPAIDFIKKNGASSDIQSHIDVLDMTPTTAVVRLVTDNDAIGSDCSEYITLIKTYETWTIISKAFVQFDR